MSDFFFPLSLHLNLLVLSLSLNQSNYLRLSTANLVAHHGLLLHPAQQSIHQPGVCRLRVCLGTALPQHGQLQHVTALGTRVKHVLGQR